MTLHLRITKAPDGAPPNQTQQTLDERGGSIGRGPGNSWVLPDPERILSSRHCEFVCEGGRYQLVDHSTNGTFVNGSTEPVGKGIAIAIHHGDEIEVGDYRFAVELGAVSQAPADSPFAQSYSPDVENIPAPALDDPFASDPFDSTPSLSLNGGSEVMDPLQALDQVGNANDASGSDSSPWGFESEPGGFSSDLAHGAADPFPETGPWSDTSGTSALRDSGPAGDAIAWPESHPENLIPDDWLEDEPAGTSSTPFQAFSPQNQPQDKSPGQYQSRPSQPSQAEPTPARVPTPGNRAAGDASLGIEDASPFGGQEPSAYFEEGPSAARYEEPSAYFEEEPSAVRYEEPSAYLEQEPSALRREQPSPAPQRPRPGAKTGSQAQGARPERIQPQEPMAHEAPRGKSRSSGNTPSSVDGDALIEAMGLDASRLSEAERAELYPLAGRLVREVVSGLMQVLRSRASIKNEFRMNVTTIQPVENNPLKFSADVDEALENIFVRRSPAYKPPLEAVHEGFQEIAEHQLAMIAGMRRGFEQMLQEFNPEHLEPRFKKQQKPSPIPALQQRRYWLLFQEYYQDLNDNIERSFQQVFGDEFVQAYQDQLQRLSASRSSSGKG